jgi:hypothetical protein
MLNLVHVWRAVWKMRRSASKLNGYMIRHVARVPFSFFSSSNTKGLRVQLPKRIPPGTRTEVLQAARDVVTYRSGLRRRDESGL